MNRDDPLVLLDTSVLIEHFNHPHSQCGRKVRELIEGDRACTAGVVLTEILQGIKGDQESKEVLSALAFLPYIEADREDWFNAGLYSQKLRNRGIAIPVTDMILAMLCLRHSLSLFTMDKHFDHIKELKRYRL